MADESGPNNLFMARCGGIAMDELNTLEVECCRLLEWRLVPSQDQMQRVQTALEDSRAPMWDAWRNTRREVAT
eukprot:2578920-Prymnesium_polylepis.1